MGRYRQESPKENSMPSINFLQKMKANQRNFKNRLKRICHQLTCTKGNFKCILQAEEKLFQMETQKHSKEQRAKMVANIWVNLNEN